MSTRVHLLLGSKKGVFFLDGDEGRRTWKVRGPYHGAGVYHVNYDSRSGTCFASLNDYWFGSAIGRSPDFGQTWHHANRGLRVEFPESSTPEWGQCIHKLAMHPSRPQVIFGQNHWGTYRSDDGGGSWTEVTEGLPSDFGFPIAVHPREPDTIWVVPEVSGFKHFVPDGAMAAWRSRDGGAHWQRLDDGLPREHAYLGILRDALAVDTLDPCGVYVATNTGQVFASHDEGDHWQLIVDYLPPLYSIEVAVVA